MAGVLFYVVGPATTGRGRMAFGHFAAQVPYTVNRTSYTVRSRLGKLRSCASKHRG
jgi:hypothetical protein